MRRKVLNSSENHPLAFPLTLVLPFSYRTTATAPVSISYDFLWKSSGVNLPNLTLGDCCEDAPSVQSTANMKITFLIQNGSACVDIQGISESFLFFLLLVPHENNFITIGFINSIVKFNKITIVFCRKMTTIFFNTAIIRQFVVFQFYCAVIFTKLTVERNILWH